MARHTEKAPASARDPKMLALMGAGALALVALLFFVVVPMLTGGGSTSSTGSTGAASLPRPRVAPTATPTFRPPAAAGPGVINAGDPLRDPFAALPQEAAAAAAAVRPASPAPAAPIQVPAAPSKVPAAPSQVPAAPSQVPAPPIHVPAGPSRVPAAPLGPLSSSGNKASAPSPAARRIPAAPTRVTLSSACTRETEDVTTILRALTDVMQTGGQVDAGHALGVTVRDMQELVIAAPDKRLGTLIQPVANDGGKIRSILLNGSQVPLSFVNVLDRDQAAVTRYCSLHLDPLANR